MISVLRIDNVSSLYPIFELPQQPGVPTRRESLRMEFNNIENINRNDDPRALPNSFNLSIEKYLDTIAVEKVRPTNSLLLVHQPNNDNEDPSSGRVSRADESPQRVWVFVKNFFCFPVILCMQIVYFFWSCSLHLSFHSSCHCEPAYVLLWHMIVANIYLLISTLIFPFLLLKISGGSLFSPRLGTDPVPTASWFVDIERDEMWWFVIQVLYFSTWMHVKLMISSFMRLHNSYYSCLWQSHSRCSCE